MVARKHPIDETQNRLATPRQFLGAVVARRIVYENHSGEDFSVSEGKANRTPVAQRFP